MSPGATDLMLHPTGGRTPALRRPMATLQLGEGPCGTIANNRASVYVADVQASDAPHAQVIRRMGLRSYAGFPLLVGERLLGTLSFGSYEQETIREDEIEFLSTIAQY